jgi:spermidine synthase
MAPPSKRAKTLYRTRGLVHDLIVTRKSGALTLWSAAGIRHTVFDSSAPHVPGLEYARNMLAALAFCPQATSCLVLGLGGGSIPRMLLAARPQMQAEAVEIDPAVVEVAAKFFDVRMLPRLTIHVEDAAAFLRRCTARFAIIIVDTYVGERFPDRCATEDFVRDARKCLLDDGSIAVNWLSDDSKMRQELLKNLEAAVGPVWQLQGLRSQNVVYFAAARRTDREAIIASAAALHAEIPFENSLKRLAQRLRAVRPEHHRQ